MRSAGTALMLKLKSLFRYYVVTSGHRNDLCCTKNGLRKLSGVNWCGCRTVRLALEQSMKWKLIGRPLLKLCGIKLPDIRAWCKDYATCRYCGSFYTISLARKKLERQFTVIRFLNLNDASTYAAHLHVAHRSKKLGCFGRTWNHGFEGSKSAPLTGGYHEES